MKITVEITSPENFDKGYFMNWLYHHLNCTDRHFEYGIGYYSGAPTMTAGISLVETSN